MSNYASPIKLLRTEFYVFTSSFHVFSLVFGLLFLLLSTNAHAVDIRDLSQKNKLIATYLFNFTKFIEWPDLSERDPRSEIIICFQPDSEIADFMQQLVSGRTVGAKRLPVWVRVFQQNERCDMIYLEQRGFFESLQVSVTPGSDNARENLQEVLIVASNIDLYPESAAISFYEQQKRLRFEVNMNKMKSLKIKAHSELLKLARIKQ